MPNNNYRIHSHACQCILLSNNEKPLPLKCLCKTIHANFFSISTSGSYQMLFKPLPSGNFQQVPTHPMMFTDMEEAALTED